MRKGFLVALCVGLAGAGPVLGQQFPNGAAQLASAAPVNGNLLPPLPEQVYAVPVLLPAGCGNRVMRPLDDNQSVDQALNDVFKKFKKPARQATVPAGKSAVAHAHATVPAGVKAHGLVPAAAAGETPGTASTLDQKLKPADLTLPSEPLVQGCPVDTSLPDQASVRQNCVEDTSGVDKALDGECAPNRFWVNGEYLLWFMKSSSIAAPLVSTSPPSSLGFLGAPGTAVLYGNDNVKFGPISGGRATAGYFFDCTQEVGLESTWLLFERKFSDFQASSNGQGQPLLVSPFTNSLTGLQNASFIALPNQNSGLVQISNSTKLWGGELNLIHGSRRGDCVNADWLYGVRYVNLDEALTDDRLATLLPGIRVPFNGGLVTAPATFLLNDRFQVKNQFFGVQTGYRWEYGCDRWFVGLTGKLALGAANDVLTIQGSTTVIRPGSRVSVPTGVYALSSNIGKQTVSDFALLPEGEFRLGYHLSDHVVMSVAYNFLYISTVVRPGDQISGTLNTTLLSTSKNFGPLQGTVAPPRVIDQTDFWVQGVSLGLAIAF